MAREGASAATILLAVGLAGCAYSGDWLFPEQVINPIVHLGELEPQPVTSRADVDDAVYFGELGATGTAEIGGATFTFQGTGDSVCVWVDPELASWNQSVSRQNPAVKWSYPPNMKDDGDLMLKAGLAVYYNGTPGEVIGDFAIRYDDGLGNPVEVEMNECIIRDFWGDPAGTSGRGAPEYCTLPDTQPGVEYMVLLETWSTPLDDHRLGYGLLLADGSCEQMMQSVAPDHEECMILGEAINPESVDDEINPSSGVPWDGSIDFELAFCETASSNSLALRDFCRNEADAKNCEQDRCFCGDPDNMPK